MPEPSNARARPLEFVIKTFDCNQTTINRATIQAIKKIFTTSGIPVKVTHKKQKPEH